jgi:hypothetical protein
MASKVKNMEHKTIEQKKEELTHKTFLLMFRILIIFGIPAIVGFFIGKYLDTTYDIRPYGTLGILLTTFLFSWLLTIRMYINIRKEFKVLEAEEEKEIKRRQKDIQEKLNINKE